MSLFLYLLQTYIVTSKPKRISVADGFVHIIVLPFLEIFTTSVIISEIEKNNNNRGLVYAK